MIIGFKVAMTVAVLLGAVPIYYATYAYTPHTYESVKFTMYLLFMLCWACVCIIGWIVAVHFDLDAVFDSKERARRRLLARATEIARKRYEIVFKEKMQYVIDAYAFHKYGTTPKSFIDAALEELSREDAAQ